MEQVSPHELMAFARRQLKCPIPRRKYTWQQLLDFKALPPELVNLILEYAGDPPATLTRGPIDIIRPIYVKHRQEEREAALAFAQSFIDAHTLAQGIEFITLRLDS